MADCKQTFSRKGLTVDEILSLLESDDGNINNENIIYVEPLIELEGQATDEDSDKSDEEHDANLNHLGRKLLRTKCELRRFHTNRGSNQDQCLHESSSSSDSEDDVPLSTLKKGLQPAKKRRVDLWKKQIPNFSCTEFSQRIPPEEAFNCKTPTDFFKLFFNQELIKQIVDQSNIYAGQKNKQLMVTEDEIYVILGGMILSGYAKLPNKRLYFSRDNDVPKLLSENIRCNRFESTCRWKDNNVVTVATNFENMTMTTATRWSHVNKAKIALPQPSLISNYNKYMGGVDKYDQAIANLRTRMRIRKWWWPIFAYFVDVSIVNGWLLAKKVGCNKDTESLFAFRRYVARTLLVTDGTLPHQGRKPATPLSTTRFDCLNHWIVPINSERRCANKCGGKSKYKCQKCEVGLHPKCFMEYHVEPNT